MRKFFLMGDRTLKCMDFIFLVELIKNKKQLKWKVGWSRSRSDQVVWFLLVFWRNISRSLLLISRYNLENYSIPRNRKQAVLVIIVIVIFLLNILVRFEKRQHLILGDVVLFIFFRYVLYSHCVVGVKPRWTKRNNGEYCPGLTTGTKSLRIIILIRFEEYLYNSIHHNEECIGLFINFIRWLCNIYQSRYVQSKWDARAILRYTSFWIGQYQSQRYLFLECASTPMPSPRRWLVSCFLLSSVANFFFSINSILVILILL